MKQSNAASMAAAVIPFMALTAPSGAALIRDVAVDPQHRELAGRYLVGASEPLNQGGGAGAIGVFVPGLGTLRASMTFINSEWGLTARHVLAPYVDINGISITGYTGPNYLTNPGTAIVMDRVVLYPNGNADLALVHFATPRPEIQQVVYGGSVQNEIMTGVGAGQWGSPAVGILPRDGNLRAYRGRSDPTAPGGVAGLNPAFWGSFFLGTTPVTTLEGRGLNGDSGSAVWNSAGQLAGIAGRGVNDSFIVGDTLYTRTDNAEVTSWLTMTAVVPEPGALASLLVPAGMLGARRRRG